LSSEEYDQNERGLEKNVAVRALTAYQMKKNLENRIYREKTYF